MESISAETNLFVPSSSGTINAIVDEAEGIWSADIEQSFLEALAIYPPCGRRKIILTEEGKMYGRNELVARYIKIRTGKTRTRKQVSSHLQVLAKRRSKEIQSLRNDKVAQQIILERIKQYTSAEIVSMSRDKLTTDKTDSFSDDDNEDEEEQQQSRQDKKIITTPVKNLLQPIPINNHSFSPQTSAMKKLTNKKTTPVKKTNESPAPMINTSIPHEKFRYSPSPLVHPQKMGRSRCSSHASSPSSLSSGSTSSQGQLLINPLISSCARIGDEFFRLHDLSAFVEIKRTLAPTHHVLAGYPTAEVYSAQQHDLLRLHTNDIQMKTLHSFETISIDQISDKFPRDDGLKDLFEMNSDGSFYLIKFWADVSAPISISNVMQAREESFFTSYTYTSCSNRPIHISTRLCSFGKQVLEKVETSEHPQREQSDQYVYRFDRAPLCDYMVQFIQKLRSLPNNCMMNSVLENFTVLQVIKCLDNPDQLLLCLAFVFEIAMTDTGGPQYQVYKLVAN